MAPEKGHNGPGTACAAHPEPLQCRKLGPEVVCIAIGEAQTPGCPQNE